MTGLLQALDKHFLQACLKLQGNVIRMSHHDFEIEVFYFILFFIFWFNPLFSADPCKSGRTGFYVKDLLIPPRKEISQPLWAALSNV